MGKPVGYGALVLFIGSVFGANWAIEQFGVVQVGLGQAAPAGVFFAGLAFTARDLVHDALRRRWVVAGIIIGAFLSWWVAPMFAVASGIAFLVSETADFAVYSPLRRRGWLRAVAASNVVGLAVDSALFLSLAFGSLDFLPGQLLAKAYMTLLAIILLRLGRHALLPRHT